MQRQLSTAFAHAQPLPAAPLDNGMAVPHFLETILDRPIAYHRVFFTLTGSVKAALFLSQAIYWSKRVKNPEGWFFKYQDEWFEETGLTRREQEAARTKLRQSGVLEEDRKGTPAKLYFRINFENLSKELTGLHQAEITKSANQGCTKAPIKDAQKRQSGLAKTANQESAKGANKIEQNSQPFLIEQRLPAETTAGSRAHAHEGQPPAAEKLSAYPLETIQQFVKAMKPHATKPEGLAIHLQRTGEDDLQIAGWLAEREEFAARAAQQRQSADTQRGAEAEAIASHLLQQGGIRTLIETTELITALDYFYSQCDDPVTGREFACTTFRQLKKLIPYARDMQRAAIAESEENGYLRCFAEALEFYANAAHGKDEPENAHSGAP